jgi:hypothetical protein
LPSKNEYLDNLGEERIEYEVAGRKPPFYLKM